MLPITLSIVEDLDEVREGLSCYLGSKDEFLILETFRSAEEAAAKLPEIEPDILHSWVVILRAGTAQS